MKYILTCHVEPLNNSTNIDYLRHFYQMINKLTSPPILLLMVGETAQSNLLRFHQIIKHHLPPDCLIGVHIHSISIRKAAKKFEKIVGKKPTAISFGHWMVDAKSDPDKISSAGITLDFSYSAYRQNDQYFTKAPFKLGKVCEFPVSCDPHIPLNPFYSWYHFFITLLLFFSPSSSSKFVHIYFHSYDLYPLTWTKRMRWQVINLLPKVNVKELSSAC